MTSVRLHPRDVVSSAIYYVTIKSGQDIKHRRLAKHDCHLQYKSLYRNIAFVKGVGRRAVDFQQKPNPMAPLYFFFVLLLYICTCNVVLQRSYHCYLLYLPITLKRYLYIRTKERWYTATATQYNCITVEKNPFKTGRLVFRGFDSHDVIFPPKKLFAFDRDFDYLNALRIRSYNLKYCVDVVCTERSTFELRCSDAARYNIGAM